MSKERENPYPHAEFGNYLESLLLKRRMNQSNLARAVWGSMTDPRGYNVARNRDRIGHYLSGRSFPAPDTMQP